MKLFSLLFFLPVSIYGQLSYGIIGGVPFSGLTQTNSFSSDQSGHYTVGPTLQFGLPLGFRFEADALYRPVGSTIANYSSAQWRFPVLLQYRLSFPVVKPFIEAGYSYGYVKSLLLFDPLTSVSLPPPTHGSQSFVVGAGLDFKVPFVRISPEIRYTRDLGPNYLFNANQAEFLVGVRF